MLHQCECEKLRASTKVYDEVKDKTVKSPKKASGKWTRTRKLHTNGMLGVHNYKIMYRKKLLVCEPLQIFFPLERGGIFLSK